MKSNTWNEVLLAEHRAYLRDDEVRDAFDVLVAAAVDLPGFQCAPAMQGVARIFTYNDAAERPFAFIVNRKHLLFYVRRAGLSRVSGGLKALKAAFQGVSENTLGEWTIPIATEEQASRLQNRLFPENGRPLVTKRGIPDGITQSDVLRALEQLDAGLEHGFGESLKYDLIHEDRRYAPKAVIGLAAARLAGRRLLPADFSGGQDSKATKILRELGFSVEPKAGQNDPDPDKTYRTDPVAAGEVFESIIGSLPAPSRSLAIAALRQSIQYATEHFPDRWILTLHPTYVRFIAGMVQCLVYRKDGSASILLLRKTAPKSLRRGAGTYENAPGCLEAYLSLQDLITQYKDLEDPHRSAIKICAERRPVNVGHRQAYSPGLVTYLEAQSEELVAEPEQLPIGRLFGDEMAIELEILQRADLTETEKQALVKARRGQGLFKDRVARVEPRCRITGVDSINHLRASHIKPWRDATNDERLSGENGLLLAPHVDHLFDQGFISFTDFGDLLVSPKCSDAVLAAWGIPKELNVGPFRAGQRQFLAYHRAQVFQA